MSLSERIAEKNGHSNGHTIPNPALVEYEQAAAGQTAIDAVLRHAGYTGICHDEVTGDWAIWQQGRVVGWDASPGGAVRRLTDCEASQAAHPQPTASVSSTRDELPCSVEFQRSSKGEAYWTLKSYCAPGAEREALDQLQDLDAKLAGKYRPELAPAE